MACGRARRAAPPGFSWWPRSEVPLLLLLLHRRRRVAVDDPTLALRRRRRHQLTHDAGQGLGVALDRAGQRIAAEGAEPDLAHARRLAVMERHPVVVDHDQRAVALDDRPGPGEVQGDDRDLLAVDVPPDVELGPVGKRKHAHRFTPMLHRVVKAPELGSLSLRVPSMLRRAEGEDALLGTRRLFVAPRTADGGVEAVL